MEIKIFEAGPEVLQAMKEVARNAKTILIGTAYVTESGLKELLPYLRAKDKQVKFLCGVGNMNSQQPPALKTLQDLAESSSERISFGLVHSSAGIFHP